MVIFQLNKYILLSWPGKMAFKYAFVEDIEVVLKNFLLALEEIKKLDGKGAITMSILQKREEKGMQKGMRRGMQEGRKEGVQKVARNLLKEGVEIALVAKCTGLSESEVEKLKEELNN